MGAELLAGGGRCVAVPLCSDVVESWWVDSYGLASGFLRSVLCRGRGLSPWSEGRGLSGRLHLGARTGATTSWRRRNLCCYHAPWSTEPSPPTSVRPLSPDSSYAGDLEPRGAGSVCTPSAGRTPAQSCIERLKTACWPSDRGRAHVIRSR